MGNRDGEARLEFLLNNWARWMRKWGSVSRWYPSKSCGFTEYGESSVEDMEHTSDTWIARAVDAVIGDLPDQERSAIHHQYLDSRYKFQIVFYAATLHNAKKLILAGMEKKGIW